MDDVMWEKRDYASHVQREVRRFCITVGHFCIVVRRLFRTARQYRYKDHR